MLYSAHLYGVTFHAIDDPMLKLVRKYSLAALVLSPIWLSYGILFFSAISNHRTLISADLIVFIASMAQMVFFFYIITSSNKLSQFTLLRYVAMSGVMMLTFAIIRYCKDPERDTIETFIALICSTNVILLVMQYVFTKHNQVALYI